MKPLDIPTSPPSLEEMVERERAAGFVLGAFERHWLIQNRAPESVRRALELARKHPDWVMTRQGFGAFDINDPNTSSFTARSTSNTEMSLLGSDANGAPTQAYVNQFCAIPANDARAGKVYELDFGGIYSTTGTPTLTFTPRWGSSTTIGTNVTFGASPAVTTANNSSNVMFYGKLRVTIRTAGLGATGGTAMGNGFLVLGSALCAGMGGTAATIDTTGQGTAGCGIQMGVTWSASSASNAITPQNWWLRSLN